MVPYESERNLTSRPARPAEVVIKKRGGKRKKKRVAHSADFGTVPLVFTAADQAHSCLVAYMSLERKSLVGGWLLHTDV